MKVLLDHPTFAVKSKEPKEELSQHDNGDLPSSLKGSEGSRCLDVACSEGDLETVKLLTEDPRIKIRGSEIMVAARFGGEEVVRFLASSPRHAVTQVVLTSALMSAVEENALGVVDFFVGRTHRVFFPYI